MATEIEVITDLYNKLSTIAGITAVYDSSAPFSAVSPYIVISTTFKNDGRLLSNAEKKLTITINIWSNYHGKKECYNISKLVHDVLEPEYDFVSSNVIQDYGSNWYRAIETYEIYY